jgi:acetyl-CoA carboxylase biotin carboxyl carrier protein
MPEDEHSQIEALSRLFQEHGLEELLVEEGAFKLHLRRDDIGPPSPMPAKHPTSKRPRREPKRESPGRARTVAVRSPLIGIFYRAASPDDDPFVEIGDLVEEGQTVCVIEAMKVFNEIKAEWSGRVVAIPAGNAALVQAGEPLIVLGFALEGESPKEGS